METGAMQDYQAVDYYYARAGKPYNDEVEHAPRIYGFAPAYTYMSDGAAGTDDAITVELRHRMEDIEHKIEAMELFIAYQRGNIAKYYENNYERMRVVLECRQALLDAKSRYDRENRIADLLARLVFVGNE